MMHNFVAFVMIVLTLGSGALVVTQESNRDKAALVTVMSLIWAGAVAFVAWA